MPAVAGSDTIDNRVELDTNLNRVLAFPKDQDYPALVLVWIYLYDGFGKKRTKS